MDKVKIKIIKSMLVIITHICPYRLRVSIVYMLIILLQSRDVSLLTHRRKNHPGEDSLFFKCTLHCWHLGHTVTWHDKRHYIAENPKYTSRVLHHELMFSYYNIHTCIVFVGTCFCSKSFGTFFYWTSIYNTYTSLLVRYNNVLYY